MLKYALHNICFLAFLVYLFFWYLQKINVVKLLFKSIFIKIKNNLIFMKNLLNKLHISESKNLFEFSEEFKWKNVIPARLHKGLEKINPDYFFVQENRIIALFFDFTEENREDKIFKDIWNLWWSPIVYILKNWLLDIYNWLNFNTENTSFKKIKKEINLENKELEEFSLLNMLSWNLWNNKEFEKKNTVDEELLKNLKNTREILIKELSLDKEITTNIIWRLLFSRYLVDRWVKVKKEFQEYFEDKTEFAKLIKNKKLLYKYFEYLKITFNWDLFPVLTLENNDKGIVEKLEIKKEHLDILFDLFNWDEVIYWKNTQQSLFNLYDFKIIPIELISEIYEQFMWEKQDENSAFYTPSFLVDYILEKTVKKHLEKNNECRVFDPSCGSWIFLVESLRQIIEKNLPELDKSDTAKKIKELQNIIKNNIFWVDKDEDAISVTIFSLCLTMLDYIDSKDISKWKVKFPTLKNKNWKWWKNLFVSDFFDLENSFNSEIKDLDFILGNPPWGSYWKRQKAEKHLEYIDILKKKYSEKKVISDFQISESFILRMKDFSNKNTKNSLVLPSKILYNYNAKEFRSVFINNFILTEILELSPVRKKLFSWAVAPTFIAFFKDEENLEKIKNNIVIHKSIKPNLFLDKLKILVIEKNDIKNVQQKYFLKDYLWKILLYWNILDFHLIKRLKENYKNINDNIELYSDSWFQVWWWWKNDSSHLIWKTFLDVSKKKENSFTRFFIKDNILDKFNLKTLHRPRKKELFQEWPKLLCKEWLFLDNLSICSSYTEKDYVFAKSVTSVYWKNTILLKSISAILNSIFGNYYLIQQWSYLWVEREIIIKEDIINFPIREKKEIANLVDKIQEKYIKINELYLPKENKEQLNFDSLIDRRLKDSFKEFKNLEKEKNNLEQKLNDLVLESFDFSESERDLLNYTKEITIPLINNNKAIFEELNWKKWEKYLTDYANLFLEYFSNTWNWDNKKYFEIDIYIDKYLVWMNFKVSTKNREGKIKFIDDKNILEEFKDLVELWEEKITDTFYESRDIRWFNKHSFYIVKYNQKKNWHKWVWQADLSEFIGAMMKSWVKKINNNL